MPVARRIKDKITQSIYNAGERAMLNLLRKPNVERRLWEVFYLPRGAYMAQDIQLQLYRQAAAEAADYVVTKIPNAVCYATGRNVLEAALAEVKLNGLYLEFGVASGASVNFIAQRTTQLVHGFDSFEGLPEDWISGRGRGHFTTSGKLPDVAHNVRLHRGLFHETLPQFAAEHTESIAFMDVTSDLCSSARTILDILGDRVIGGTVIRFGEYFNYPGWKLGEYKAFQEFVARRKLKYRYIGYNRRNYSVALVIEGNDESSP